MSCAGLVLAAGEGRRFGAPKAPVVVDGERLVDRAVRVLAEAGCAPVAVVLGAWVGDVPGAHVVVNQDWSSGMGSSLRTGLEWLAANPAAEACDRVLVHLVDLPGVTADAVARLMGTGGEMAVATYAGERGHPVMFTRPHWQAVGQSASGDRGARDYLAAHDRQVLRVEVGDVARGDDLDVPL